MSEHTPAPTAGRGGEWRASRLLRRPVMHAGRVMHVGAVADVAFAPETNQLTGLLVGPLGTEGGLYELVRRALGGDLGLTYLPMERITALDGDVVVIDGEPTREHEQPPRLHAPRLRLVQGLAVVTARGRRLGAFADLLLDEEGRRITGYLVEQSAPPPARQPSGQPAEATTGAPSLLVIPSSFEVRIGHGLIVVGEEAARRPEARPEVRSAPTTPSIPTDGPREWPAPDWAAAQEQAPAAPPPPESPPPDAGDTPTSPDAPPRSPEEP